MLEGVALLQDHQGLIRIQQVFSHKTVGFIFQSGCEAVGKAAVMKSAYGGIHMAQPVVADLMKQDDILQQGGKVTVDNNGIASGTALDKSFDGISGGTERQPQDLQVQGPADRFGVCQAQMTPQAGGGPDCFIKINFHRERLSQLLLEGEVSGSGSAASAGLPDRPNFSRACCLFMK